jgi:hypothetical protein
MTCADRRLSVSAGGQSLPDRRWREANVDICRQFQHRLFNKLVTDTAKRFLLCHRH